MISSKEIIKELKSKSSQEVAEKTKYFGSKASNILGVRIPDIREIAKIIKTNHNLALELWQEGYHESRMLATIIADPQKLSIQEVRLWSRDFDSWDIVDAASYNLIRYVDFYDDIIFEFCKQEEEYIRRTSFSLIAGLAAGRKDIEDKEFLKYFSIIREYSFDDRGFVWKSINWAIRQIGKRSLYLYPYSLDLSKELSQSNNPIHRKIGKGALRELSDEKIISRIK